MTGTYWRKRLSASFPVVADYEKANEIYFRLGIIYKQQNKYPASLEVSFLEAKEELPWLCEHIC